MTSKLILPIFFVIHTLFASYQFLTNSREFFPFANFSLYTKTPSVEIFPTILITEINHIKLPIPLNIFEHLEYSKRPAYDIRHVLTIFKWVEQNKQRSGHDLQASYQYINNYILDNSITAYQITIDYFNPYDKLKNDTIIKRKIVNEVFR